MHSAAFPEYPLRGADRQIAFHLRHSPALRDKLLDVFDRFPFSGLSLLVLKSTTTDGVECDLAQLIAAADIDGRERARRQALLMTLRQSSSRDPIEFTALSMHDRR